MPQYIRLGRRSTDPIVMMDWHKKRGMAKADARYAHGIRLEEINVATGGAEKAIALVSEKWGSVVYFVNVRSTWKEDDYFELAERLMWKKGIVQP